jgi:hypothetical protein
MYFINKIWKLWLKIPREYMMWLGFSIAGACLFFELFY